uniref:NADH dehydrogenase subunit 3 n=1 Tax=Diopatra cuprea TaxID=398472 RepID=UPI001D0FD265|nr:NADH dehydrogenase subunit 3 [Diopatra cuprea]QZM06618.1 NADH dehydrogenase subunit 3 [Diopatra cuprea]
MMISLINFFIAIFISSLLISLTLVISSRSNLDREKLSPFECGFDPKNFARLPFSLRFFLLAVIFIVFDIEIALLLPIPLMLSSTTLHQSLLNISMFLSILLIGLFHEWNEGSLDWAK